MTYEIYNAKHEPLYELIQELSSRRFVLGRQVYACMGENGGWCSYELGPLEMGRPIELRTLEIAEWPVYYADPRHSLGEEEAPQIYPKRSK